MWGKKIASYGCSFPYARKKERKKEKWWKADGDKIMCVWFFSPWSLISGVCSDQIQCTACLYNVVVIYPMLYPFHTKYLSISKKCTEKNTIAFLVLKRQNIAYIYIYMEKRRDLGLYLWRKLNEQLSKERQILATR